jgi:hydroxyacylglutathione hydrolase
VAPDWLRFLPLGFPSANAIVTTRGARVLFDTGYGSDLPRLEQALAGAGSGPGHLDLVVNTHWHSDHVGGNAGLQARHGVPIAASRHDAEAVNARRPGACLAEWLDQPVEAYRVDRPLHPGDRLAAGPAEWVAVAAPGHAPGQLAFHQPDEGLLVLGDAVLPGDVGWINLPLDGPGAIDAALATLDDLAGLRVRLAFPGHGPPITDLPAALADARARYERMRADPERAGRHACRRMLAFALMVHDGIPLDGLTAHLASRPWLAAHAERVFGTSPEELAARLVADMRRSGAVGERDGRLVCRTPHHRPPRGWLRGPGYPRGWRAAASA